MSKRNNVHPDHYKTAGRGRQGEDTVPELEKRRLAEEQEYRERRRRKTAAVAPPMGAAAPRRPRPGTGQE